MTTTTTTPEAIHELVPLGVPRHRSREPADRRAGGTWRRGTPSPRTGAPAEPRGPHSRGGDRAGGAATARGRGRAAGGGAGGGRGGPAAGRGSHMEGGKRSGHVCSP